MHRCDNSLSAFLGDVPLVSAILIQLHNSLGKKVDPRFLGKFFSAYTTSSANNCLFYYFLHHWRALNCRCSIYSLQYTNQALVDKAREKKKLSSRLFSLIFGTGLSKDSPIISSAYILSYLAAALHTIPKVPSWRCHCHVIKKKTQKIGLQLLYNAPCSVPCYDLFGG